MVGRVFPDIVRRLPLLWQTAAVRGGTAPSEKVAMTHSGSFAIILSAGQSRLVGRHYQQRRSIQMFWTGQGRAGARRKEKR